MMKSGTSPRIGIDGGGTSCRFGLQLSDRLIVVTGGSANIHSDPETALRTLRDGIAALAHESGMTAEGIARVPTYAGLAGVSNRAHMALVVEGLGQRFLRVENDSRPAVVGALGGGNGCVAGIGTGSYLAHKDGAAIRVMGGYGAELGDEASGGWLGRQLLMRVLHICDGLGRESPFTAGVLARFDGDKTNIVAFGRRAAPAEFGRFAPDIVAAARDGDANAVALMQAGADYIGRGLAALGHLPGQPLCLIGGLGPHYAEFLPAPLRAGLIEPQGSALDGAMMMAAASFPAQMRDTA